MTKLNSRRPYQICGLKTLCHTIECCLLSTFFVPKSWLSSFVKSVKNKTVFNLTRCVDEQFVVSNRSVGGAPLVLRHPAMNGERTIADLSLSHKISRRFLKSNEPHKSGLWKAILCMLKKGLTISTSLDQLMEFVSTVVGSCFTFCIAWKVRMLSRLGGLMGTYPIRLTGFKNVIIQIFLSLLKMATKRLLKLKGNLLGLRSRKSLRLRSCMGLGTKCFGNKISMHLGFSFVEKCFYENGIRKLFSMLYNLIETEHTFGGVIGLKNG